MALLALTVPTAGGATVAPITPTASDTIALASLGDRGAYLRIETTGTATSVTVSDAGKSPAGNPASASAVALSATEVKAVYISPRQADLVTGLVTVTSTSQTGVTYELYPA